MIIKKFQAKSEGAAISLAKEEYGSNAVVVGTKLIPYKGVYRFFKKPQVEVTVAVEDDKKKNAKELTYSKKQVAGKKNDNTVKTSKPVTNNKVQQTTTNNKMANSIQSATQSDLEERIKNLQKLIEKQIDSKKGDDTKPKKANDNTIKKENPTKVATQADAISESEEEISNISKECMQLVEKQMLKQEVDKEYVGQILDEVGKTLVKGAPVDNILTTIYQKIVLKLGQTSLIGNGQTSPKYIFFMGPTGVGKTTTIAKIASDFKINKKLNVALLTSDTYRIAAVEQLRIYANMLKTPLHVVYTPEEITKIKPDLKKYDVVLIDTAGRSHKNLEQKDDLRKLINTIDKAERSEYLVLSATTKYSDLKNIVEAYQDIEDYKLLFTKLDETTSVGNILNVKMLTGADLSYVTFGQDVPSDIGKLDAQDIARKLLGGKDGSSD